MRKYFVSLIAVVAVALLVSESTAQVVPFRAAGSNAIYTPGDGMTSSGGRGTHVGRLFGSGMAVPVADLGNGLFEWVALNYQLTGADGSQIFFDGGGFVQFIPIEGNEYFAIWTGEFNVLGGNGRFANVGPGTAPIEVVATNDPFELDENGDPLEGAVWTYTWTLIGDIDLGRRGKK